MHREMGRTDEAAIEERRRRREASPEERAVAFALEEIKAEAMLHFDSADRPENRQLTDAQGHEVLGRASVGGTREFLLTLKRALRLEEDSLDFRLKNPGLERNIVLIVRLEPETIDTVLDPFVDNLLATLSA